MNLGVAVTLGVDVSSSRNIGIAVRLGVLGGAEFLSLDAESTADEGVASKVPGDGSLNIASFDVDAPEPEATRRVLPACAILVPCIFFVAGTFSFTRDLRVPISAQGPAVSSALS